MLSHSLHSSAESLTRDSIDCEEGTRNRGATPSSSRGEDARGLCSCRLVSGQVSLYSNFKVKLSLLCTQKAKFARVSSLWLRWSYSTNFSLLANCHTSQKYGSHAAACAPAPTTTLWRLGRRPFPRPMRLHRRASSCGVVSHELDIRVFMEIRVGVKLFRHETVQVFRARGEDEGQAIDDCVDNSRRCYR